MLSIIGCLIVVSRFGERQGRAHLLRTMPVFHLHLHKAGGSSVCAMANLHGEITSPNNCNGLPDQSCCGIDPDGFLKAHPYTFVASERQLPPLRVDLFRYMTVLREPIARSISHYRHLVPGKFSESAYEVWAQHQPDNWYVRYICGDPCMHVPRGRLGVAHLNVALQRLMKFDYIYILKNLDSDGWSQMARDLGWPHPGQRAPASHSNVRAHNTAAQLSTACRQRLGNLFYLDHLIYEWATLNDTAVAHCDNECCGPCSAF